MTIKKNYTFKDAAISYLEFDDRSERTREYVERLISCLGSTALSEIEQTSADFACKKVLRPGASAATKLRSVYTPMRAIMRAAAIRRMCDMVFFDAPSVKATRMQFLLPSQVNAIAENSAPHISPLIIFLAGTGARLSEALDLHWSDIDIAGSQAIVRQKQGNDRYISLCPRVMAALLGIGHRDGRVFLAPARCREQERLPFSNIRNAGGQIRTAWATACRKAGLPGQYRTVRRGSGQEIKIFVPDHSPHSLRHTFATWHYCINRDLLGLKDDGGWGSVSMVARYAKKMPDAYRNDIQKWINHE